MNDDVGDGVGALNVWVLTDGKIGDDVQCLAVAEALAANFDKRVIGPRAPWSWIAPWGPIDPRDRRGRAESPLNGGLPDMVIASGRRAIPYACALKAASGGGVGVVILKDPRFRRAAADVIWAPMHDNLSGPNVITTLTSPHGLGAKLVQLRNNQGSEKQLGVFLGGPSGGARYDAADAVDLAIRINKAAKSFDRLCITASRRTPATFLDEFAPQLDHGALSLWRGSGKNPYLDILANASALIVAGDSHNMVSEAVASNAGVYVWRPRGIAAKLDHFVRELEQIGRIRCFSEAADPFHAAPIDATADIAAEIKRRLNLR